MFNSIFKQSATSHRMHNYWLHTYLQRYKGLLFLVLFLGLAAYFCAAGLMFVSGYLISKAATQPENIMLIYVPIVLTRVFGIARPSFRYAERLVGHNLVLRMTSVLRVRLYQAVEPDAARKRNSRKTGDILSILTDDIEYIQNLYLRIIFPSLIALMLYVLIVLVIGAFSIAFALFMLLWLGVMIILLPLVSLVINGARRYRQKSLRNSLYRSLTDAVLGVGDWVFSGRQSAFIASYEAKEDHSRALHAKSSSFSRKRDFVWQILAAVAVLAVLIWIESLTSQGNLSVNWIAAFVLAVFPLFDAMAPIPETISHLPTYRDSLQRMDRLKQVAKPTTATLPEELAGKPITINLSDLYYHYEKTQPVLQGVSLTISPQQKLAILGPSGAGKSTIVSLVRGDLSPRSGAILLNGTPSASLGENITALVGVLNQKPYLFNTTIGNNLRLGNPHASQGDIDLAITQAGLEKLIAQLPFGIDTPVEEAGARFSGGERQRIALARILLQNTPIVILDEPTIGLDPQSENELMGTFFEGLKDKTIIWITHHLQGMERMDKIVFLENGRIALEGTHAELWQTSERYRALYTMDNWDGVSA